MQLTPDKVIDSVTADSHRSYYVKSWNSSTELLNCQYFHIISSWITGILL